MVMLLSNRGAGIESISVSKAQAATLLQAANAQDSDVFNIPQLFGIRTRSESMVLRVPSQQQPHLGSCQKCGFSGPSPDS